MSSILEQAPHALRVEPGLQSCVFRGLDRYNGLLRDIHSGIVTVD